MKWMFATLAYLVIWSGFTSRLLYSADREMLSPIEVGSVSADTIGEGVVSTISLKVLCWPNQLSKVTARIVPGTGYEVVGQPPDSYERPDIEAVVFRATIRATSHGIWEVGVEVSGGWSDTTRLSVNSHFYIQVNDSSSRVLSAAEYSSLQGDAGKVTKNPTRSSKSIPHNTGKMSKPRILSTRQDSVARIRKEEKINDTTRHKSEAPSSIDTSKAKEGDTRKMIGTFDLCGSLSYHDSRDPQGWTRPAVNVMVEVWNENEYDIPPSGDQLLGTGITDWTGSYTFSFLDNTDEDGTADPYIVWRSDNADWEVRRPNAGDIYRWYSQIMRDAADDETVEFGDHTIQSYPEAM